MGLKTKIITKSKNITVIVVYDEEKPKEQHIAYKINSKRKEIHYFPPKNIYFPVDNIILAGFSSLPKEFSKKGYIKAGTGYYLGKKLSEKKVQKLVISRNQQDAFKKEGRKYKVTLSYKSFKELKDRLTLLIYESQTDKNMFVNSFFHTIFPKYFRKTALSDRQKAKRVVGYFDKGMIGRLERQDVEKLLDFFEMLLKTKYRSAVHRRKLFQTAKIKVDDVALAQIIKDFEKMLAESCSEGDWGAFLRQNLFLIDSKYVKTIPELNVVLAGARKVDFGLVDSQGYLDIFEIKKPDTPILAKSIDRGNYYWSTRAVKAITQAEKYLYNAEAKSSSLAKDIKRERGIDVQVVRPRAILIIGNSRELDNQNKREDFRVLRSSLKNVEVISYDELLKRIKNQSNKIYVE